MSRSYDVVVIGAGPAGYIAAIRAAQQGKSVACIDEWKNKDGKNAFGGTCLNAGCIPSKALLESSELYHRAGNEFRKHGIRTGEVEMDIAAMQKRRAGIVRQLTGGIAGLFKANNVEGLVGHGKLLKGKKVEFTPVDGDVEIIDAQHVILASGSAPIELPVARFDGESIIDSWDTLELDAVPETLGVVGAGVIGLELGSVWARLGARVTILEAMDDFLFMADRDVAKVAAADFKKQGLDIKLGAMVSKATVGKNGVTVEYKDKGGEQSIDVEKLVVAVGRRPVTDNLFADDAGIQLDERGFVVVDEECRTRVCGEIAEMNYDVIPLVLYTSPEIAWTGKTEAEVKESGISYKTGQFPFMASGRAKAMEQTSGFVKIISAEEDDEILGVHIVGPMAGELISEAVLALEFSASTEDIQRTIHAHPSLAEAVHEAALAVDGKALNFPNR
jgi:dihydrolipoamide dehydrogenase